jgi:hypothetical protein
MNCSAFHKLSCRGLIFLILFYILDDVVVLVVLHIDL